MQKISLGLMVGSGLGLLDGVSAMFNPAAHAMLVVIIVSATVKGAITGAAVGLLANKIDGRLQNTAAGAIVGTVLSVLAAVPSGTYLSIIAPGVAIGALCGLIVSKRGR